MKNKIPGGMAANKKPSDFDSKALAKGIKVEMEHTSSKEIATEIAMDHLTEDPKYYDKLEVMEKSSFWGGFSEKQAASNKIKTWLYKLKKSNKKLVRRAR